MTIFLTCFGYIFAVPALPSLLEITQPNGIKFRAYLRGDEYFSWWESEKGTVLFRNIKSGYFEYAKITFNEDKGELISSGVVFPEEETSIRNARSSNITRTNLAKIWMQKRKEAINNIRGILEEERE